MLKDIESGYFAEEDEEEKDGAAGVDKHEQDHETMIAKWNKEWEKYGKFRDEVANMDDRKESLNVGQGILDNLKEILNDRDDLASETVDHFGAELSDMSVTQENTTEGN